KRAALLVARENRANLLRARERLVKFHAGATGVSEDRVHALAFEAGDQDVAALHEGPHLAAGMVLAGRARLRRAACLRFQCLRRFAHTYSFLSAAVRATKNPRPLPAVGFCLNLF